MVWCVSNTQRINSKLQINCRFKVNIYHFWTKHKTNSWLAFVVNLGTIYTLNRCHVPFRNNNMKAFLWINQFLLHLLSTVPMLFVQHCILVLISLLFSTFVVGLDNVNVQLKSIKKSLKDFNILNANGNYLEDIDIKEFLDIFNEMDKMLTIYEKNYESNTEKPTTASSDKEGRNYIYF